MKTKRNKNRKGKSKVNMAKANVSEDAKNVKDTIKVNRNLEDGSSELGVIKACAHQGGHEGNL